jgi:glyoxylase-like metal-dependent hydrolase (beta-lactamase superfamily II)
MKTLVTLVALALSLGACARLTPEQQIVHDAATALGGRDRVLAVKTLVVEGTGMQYNFGQDLTPEATGQHFVIDRYRRAMDVASGRIRTELTRRPNFAYFQGPGPRPETQGIDGTLGYNVGANGAAARIPDSAVDDRQAEWSQHPLLAVRAALDPAAKLANARTEGGRALVDVTSGAGATFTLAVDTASSLPASVATRIHDPNIGDATLSTAFSDYQDVGGLRLPASLATRLDEYVLAAISVAKQTVDGDTGDLAAPREATAAAPVAPAPQVVTAVPVAKGITLLAGGSHHSLLVEFSDHLMLFDAPNATRTAAVIAKARELVPGKPLTQLVTSHHHFDHSGGVRTAIAEGMTVITHQGNVAFFEALARRPRTIQPDALAKSGRIATIEGVGEVRTISDGTMTVALYPLSSSHSETMLIAYFPQQRLVAQADQYTPAAAVQMYAASFLEELKKRQLRVDRIVPMHGAVAPYSQLVKEVAARAAAPPG